MMKGSRAGFTFVELLVAMTIMAVLAGLAIPNITTVILRARAVELSADMDVVAVNMLGREVAIGDRG